MESGTGTGIRNPESVIRNPDIMNDDRNNSLQQCLINKYREKLFWFFFIFFALLQPQTVIVKKLLTIVVLNNPYLYIWPGCSIAR